MGGISVQRWGLGPWPGGPCTKVRGSLYGRVQCITGNGHMGPLPSLLQTGRHYLPVTSLAGGKYHRPNVDYKDTTKPEVAFTGCEERCIAD